METLTALPTISAVALVGLMARMLWVAVADEMSRMKPPSYDTEMREKAKAEKLTLLTLDCDDRFAEGKEPRVRATMQTTVPQSVGVEIWKAVRAIYEAHLKTLTVETK